MGAPGIARASAGTIRIGYLDQLTGMRANSGETAPWVLEQVQQVLAETEMHALIALIRELKPLMATDWIEQVTPTLAAAASFGTESAS